jgi:hypothetical protein
MAKTADEAKIRASAIALSDRTRLEKTIPFSNLVFGNIVYWLAILSAVIALMAPVFMLVDPYNNILNPSVTFGLVLDGAAPAEIWSLSQTGSFPGAHFYFDFIAKADSWAMLAVSLSCSISLWGLIPAIFLQLLKEKNYFNAITGALLALLIFLSMMGVFASAG